MVAWGGWRNWMGETVLELGRWCGGSVDALPFLFLPYPLLALHTLPTLYHPHTPALCLAPIPQHLRPQPGTWQHLLPSLPQPLLAFTHPTHTLAPPSPTPLPWQQLPLMAGNPHPSCDLPTGLPRHLTQPSHYNPACQPLPPWLSTTFPPPLPLPHPHPHPAPSTEHGHPTFLPWHLPPCFSQLYPSPTSPASIPTSLPLPSLPSPCLTPLPPPPAPCLGMRMVLLFPRGGACATCVAVLHVCSTAQGKLAGMFLKRMCPLHSLLPQIVYVAAVHACDCAFTCTPAPLSAACIFDRRGKFLLLIAFWRHTFVGKEKCLSFSL